MTSQPIEANVVLSADNSQYDQAMMASAGSTNDLGKSIDSLGQKISNLTKTAGKSLIGISAADVALITAATAAWSSYEKQMSQLEAQAAVITRTQTQQSRVMKDYTTSVKALRTEYGVTTAEAAKLTQTLGKVTGERQTRDLKDLSKVFVDMSKATGESSDGLATSLTSLQKVMGQQVNTSNSRKYADMFTYLSATTNTTAQGLIDFTAQLAPLGQQMGLNTKEVAGFATAFTRAGAEGYGAATVFSKVAADISKSVATGSPELKAYANLVGVTSEQFKNMEGEEKIVRIMESLQKLGPRASSELERMGLDGTRSMRSITAVINQAGGLRQALADAQGNKGKGTASEGAQASMQGLSDEFEQLREEMKKTAETMATLIGPIVEKFVGGMETIAENINDVLEGPLGEFLQVIMAVIAPLAGGTGAMLLFAGAILKVAAAFAVWRNSMSLGAREGFKGGAGITGMGDGTYGARGGGMLGERGAQIAQGGTWGQRAMYNAGQPLGAAVGGALGGVRQAWVGGRQRWDPNYTPQSRSVASYMAGGLGRGIESFVTPQLDQMRYADPSKRHQYLSQQSPWASFQQRAGLIGAQNETNAARSAAAAQQGVYQSMAGAQGADPEKVRAAKAEMHRLNQQAIAAERAERATIAQTDATRQQTRETGNSTTGFRRLTSGLGGLGAGLGGGILGAGKAGAGMLARSGAAFPAAGMLGMAGMAGAGIQNNTAMFTAMGAMMGPWGAAAGAGVGIGMDVAGQNNKVMDSLKALNEGIDSSGYAFGEMSKSIESNDKDMNDWFGEMGIGKNKPKYDSPLAKGDFLDFGETKNTIEGIFGSSDVEEAQKEFDKADKKYQNRVDAAKEVAEKAGVSMTGSAGAQLEQLEGFMNERGAQMLSEAGVTYDDLVKARAKGGSDYTEMLSKVVTPGEANGLWERLTKAGGTGATMITSSQGQQALLQQGDVKAAYDAVNTIFSTAQEQGKDYLEIMKEAEQAQQTIGVENSREHELQLAVASKAQQALGIQAQVGTRTEQFQSQMGQMKVLSSITPVTGEQAAQLDAMKQQTASMIADQVNYFKQLLLAQDQFELQRKRAEQDYNLSRQYAQHDFNLQRERSEEAFNRQRARASADFYRNERRAHFEFNLQRSRAEADFNHQVETMAKQQAIGVYNIYERIQTERTSSAEWILSNAQEQLVKMREQSDNLDKLRKSGVSDNVIQQMKLDDPQNAQQLARFVTELTPELIQQFNKTAGTQRVKAAKDLVTDPSSLEWSEMRRSYKLNMGRAAEDFERQMKQSRTDFNRGLRQQRKDYNIALDQQEEDFATSMGRQEEAYKKQMDRGAEDMANMSKEISLSMEEVLEESTKRLSGNAKTQAAAVLKSFQDLKKDTTPEAIALMKELAGIFGFEYTVPKNVSGPVGSVAQGVTGSAHGFSGGGGGGPVGSVAQALGGVIPGWTPGRDTVRAELSGGEAIMRPEWTRAVGEKAIDAMNHKARYGGFAEGGVFWPVPGHRTSTYAGHDGVDINRGSGSDDMGDPIRAFRSGKIVYVGSGRGYGQAIFEQTAAGTVVYGHTSAQAVHAGQRVNAGQLLGNVGSTGNSSAPHLHFGIPGGTTAQALALLAGAMVGGFGGMAGGGGYDQAAARAAIHMKFPKSEAAAKAMDGVHPLGPGDISKVIRRMGRDVIRRARRQMAGGDGPLDFGSEPNESLDNMGIVRTGANRIGWGDQWGSLRQLVQHESGFNNTAQNPTSSAFGMFQFLNSTWAGVGGKKTSDPWKQTQYGLKYIKDRYGNPNKAWDFWQDHNWYGDGSVFTGPQTIGVGERGPEAVIPLNDRGGEFLTKAMLGAEARGVGMGASPMRGGLSIYNTQIDRSTNFTGAITVQANDPAELISKLQARQRVMALSRPSLTGSAA